jgi:putative FmdB family regulatory protein
MPIFEYHCTDCGQTFEDLVLSRQSEPSACKECGGMHVERVHSTFAAHSHSAGPTASCSTDAPSACQGGMCPPCQMMN